MIKQKCKEILSKGKTSIVEGGSTTYGPAFIELNNKDKFCRHIIGLRAANTLGRKAKFRKRVEGALKEGLLGEVRNGLENYSSSLIMQDAYSVVPMTRYLRGELSFEEAREGVVARCLKYADEQLKTFSKYPEIIWIKHEPGENPRTVKMIISMVESKTNYNRAKKHK